MMKLIRTIRPPSCQSWRAEYDSRNPPGIDELFEWLKTNMVGTIYWQSTLFRDPRKGGGHIYSYRIRNFKDGYLMYTFWATSQRDAAFMRLMLGI